MRERPAGWDCLSFKTLIGRLALLLAALCLCGASRWRADAAEVRERGAVVCAASRALPGFAQRQADGEWVGFDVDLCRAVAAAVFGDPERVDFRSLGGDSRFAQLQTGAVDIVVRNAPWTMRRDTGYGATYVATDFFDGQAFMVPQSLGVVSAYELEDVSVCAVDDTDELTAVRDFFFENQAAYSEVAVRGPAGSRRRLPVGAVPGGIGTGTLAQRHPPQPARSGDAPYPARAHHQGTAGAGGPRGRRGVVRDRALDDLHADQCRGGRADFTQPRADEGVAVAPGRRLLGLEGDYGRKLGLGPDFMVKIIAAVGNYGEIYDRNFGPDTGTPLLRGQNSLWSNGGLIYAPPME